MKTCEVPGGSTQPGLPLGAARRGAGRFVLECNGFIHRDQDGAGDRDSLCLVLLADPGPSQQTM